MAEPIVFMYSGLGSQYHRMGWTLYQQRPVFRAAMDRMDALLTRETGRGVLAEVFGAHHGVSEPFSDPALTHPAIFMTEYALTQELAEAGLVPDLVLGASAGMLAAAVAAGALPWEEALLSSAAQPELMRRSCGPGAMVAILDEPALFHSADLDRYGEIAAYNFDTHFVLSTTAELLPEVERVLTERQVVHQKLAVGLPYHSRWIEPARDAMLGHLRALPWAPPTVPVVCCAAARQLDRPTAEQLWTVAREPIRFQQTIRALEAAGAYRYLDVGPSGTLATSVKYLLDDTASTVTTVLSPFGGELARLEQLLADAPRVPRAPRDVAPATPVAPVALAAPAARVAPVAAPAPGSAAGAGGAAGAKTAFVFPGQGSQRRGMGAGLFDEIPEYRRVEREVDEIVGYSMRTLCLEDPDKLLSDTRYTQPSLYVVNALHYYRALQEGPVPDYVAGHSLGEYNALHAAGVFGLLDGLRLVKRRAELMAEVRGGGMAAVVGLGPDAVAEVIDRHGLWDLDIANLNAPTQVVVSGPREVVEGAGPAFEAAGARVYQPLRVSAAFHSRYMREVADEFAAFLAPMNFASPAVPVVANVTAGPIPPGDPTATVASLLTRQIAQPVRWSQSVDFLLDQGVTDIRECGPGKVLARLVQQIRQAREDQQQDQRDQQGQQGQQHEPHRRDRQERLAPPAAAHTAPGHTAPGHTAPGHRPHPAAVRLAPVGGGSSVREPVGHHG
ncbi:ACP S-malonyltransferase [Kitasatospora sp. NBC_01287]|uniref:ACP S-malonyltransferase n=1 Tax=Kitasatospora sp. NBC_01287 TaxID=2903573 RepID=UPI002254EC3F|nr:ACP S-malonyltransferase [Kitasatospora sp. NBC_01287]MCX4743990.1 ACP S-malonyltransferase [Kitasatospora sp. NBC_01287]